MITGCIFPTELLYQILGYTSARDVVRWRTVSKWFCAITSKPEMWKALRSNTHFMCPPESSLISSLDRVLVRSERLAQLWSQEMQPLRLMSRTEIPISGLTSRYPNHLIGGRWFIMCKPRTVLCKGFVLYDAHPNVETRAVPTVLWEERDNQIEAWYNSMTTCREGRWVAYVFVLTGNFTRLILLELSWDADSGSPYSSVALGDFPCNGQRPIRMPSLNSSRFIFLQLPYLVFDTITRTFYEFPEFRIALDETKSRIESTAYTTVKLTDTHVIVLYDQSYAWIREPVLVQAFVVPDNQHPVENGKGILRLSHEGVFESQEAAFEFDVIRNSVVDFANGSVNVRLLEQGTQLRPLHDANFMMYCVDLTLHMSSALDVFPMTIRRHSIVRKGYNPVEDARITQCDFWDVSDQGYARGLSIGYHLESLSGCSGNFCLARVAMWVVKFSIDATGDQCTAVFDSKVEVGHTGDSDEDIHRFINASNPRFDGARGKLSYSDDYGSKIMVVVDIE